MRDVTKDELGQHGAGAEAKWLAIRGTVFDVTKFAALHPGGQQILVRHCGKDCTEVFELFHHDGVWAKYSTRLPVVGQLSGKSFGSDLKTSRVPFADPVWATPLLGNVNHRSPYFSPQHRAFRERVRDFVEKEILATMDEWASDDRPPKSLFEKMGKAGLLACLTGHNKFPREFLDPGTPEPEGQYDLFHEYIVTDEISRCGNQAVIAALTSGVAIALSAVLSYGSVELKREVCREVLMGRKTISLAVSEPAAGSDVSGLSTTAKQVGDEWVLTGNKKWITSAMWADFLVVACVTDPKKGARGGASLIVVEGKSPGLYKRKVGLPVNSKIAGTAYLEFDEVKAPLGNLVGPRDQAFKLIQYNFNHERVYHSVCCNRMARVCLEESFRFAVKRKTFGKPLAEHDAIKERLARMAAEVEAQQHWLEAVIYQHTNCANSEEEARLGAVVCALKAKGGDVFEKVANEATHIFGGNALDENSVGKRIAPMLAWTKAYSVPAGETIIMYMQSTKLALKFAKSNL